MTFSQTSNQDSCGIAWKEMGSLVRFIILTSLLQVASITAARKCPQEQFKEMTQAPQMQELIEGPAHLRFDRKIIKMPSSNSGSKDEFPMDFEARRSGTAYHDISKDFEPRPSATAYNDISKDFEPRPSATAYHDISKDFEPRPSATAYHDISKDFEPRPSATAYHDISKDFEPRPSATAYHDISKDFEPRPSATAYHDNEESKEEESSNESEARPTVAIN